MSEDGVLFPRSMATRLVKCGQWPRGPAVPCGGGSRRLHSRKDYGVTESLSAAATCGRSQALDLELRAKQLLHRRGIAHCRRQAWTEDFRDGALQAVQGEDMVCTVISAMSFDSFGKRSSTASRCLDFYAKRGQVVHLDGWTSV